VELAVEGGLEVAALDAEARLVTLGEEHAARGAAHLLGTVNDAAERGLHGDPSHLGATSLGGFGKGKVPDRASLVVADGSPK